MKTCHYCESRIADKQVYASLKEGYVLIYFCSEECLMSYEHAAANGLLKRG